MKRKKRKERMNRNKRNKRKKEKNKVRYLFVGHTYASHKQIQDNSRVRTTLADRTKSKT